MSPTIELVHFFQSHSSEKCFLLLNSTHPVYPTYPVLAFFKTKAGDLFSIRATSLHPSS